MRSFVLLACVSLVSSCFGSPSGFQQQDKSLRGGIVGKIVTKTTDGVTYAAMRADDPTEQIFEVNDIQELAGSSLSFPPGSLAISVSMNVQEAAPLATTPNALDLNLGTGFSKAGAPIVIQADKDIDLLKPMTISLPIPSTTQFMLADPFENLVVLYKVTVAGSEETRIGAFLRSEVTISNGNVIFTSSHMGAYQVAFTEKPVLQRVPPVATQAPILTKKEEAKLLTVDVGYDKDITAADLSLDARTTSAVSFKWEKVSGPGDVTFGSASAEDTKVAFTRDGTYVLRLTIQNDKGESARDDITIHYDPWSIATLGVNLVNAAADGTIDVAEAASTSVLLSVSSPEAAKISYSQGLAQSQVCDASVPYATVAPTAASLTSDGAYVFCVAFQSFSGKTYYGKSPLITRAATPPAPVTPVVTSFALANGAIDGFINASEMSSSDPLVILTATDYTTAMFTAALADSALVCDGSRTYDRSLPPRINEVPSMDGAYAVCVKLDSGAGTPVYAKSATVVRDTMMPMVNAGPDIVAGITVGLAGSASGAASFAWTKQSGPGTVTFSDAASANPSVTASADGVYVLRLTASDLAGNAAYDELALTWNTSIPLFMSLAPANEAADGYVNDAEKGAANPLWTLSASGHNSTFYTVALDDTGNITCDASQTYDQTSIPRAVDLSSDKPWVICVELRDAADNIARGKSAVVTRDIVAPTFTSLVKAAEASDGYINNSEKNSTTPIWMLTASGYASVAYTAAVMSGTTCDVAQTYPLVTTPIGASGISSNGTYMICARLVDVAGNVTYGASDTVIRDINAPTIGNDGLIATQSTYTQSTVLTWTKASDNQSAATAISYRVYYGTSANFSTLAEVQTGTGR